MSATIQQAIAGLEEARAPLAAQLAQVDAAITALKNISNGTGSAFVPDPPAPARVQRTAPKPPVEDDGATVLQYVSGFKDAHGVSLSAIAQATRLSAYLAKNALERLAKKGLVHVTGTGRGQRWHLGAKGSSPKEAESRGRR